MSELIWNDCESLTEVRSPEELAALTAGRHYIGLRFPCLRPEEKIALISRLSPALPECSVFDSRGSTSPAYITIMSVVARERVLERRVEVERAIAEYHQACAALVEQYHTGTLPQEWRMQEHGRHCRFTSLRTGQVVEAPFRDWVESDMEPYFLAVFVKPTPELKSVDPYFFAVFVKTTPGLEAVAALIDDNFHDARRILDILDTDG
jgi:hypothetical protein